MKYGMQQKVLLSLNVGSFEYFIISILYLISCLLSPGIHFYDLKNYIYSEIKFMSVWYFLLHSIFHMSLLKMMCDRFQLLNVYRE
jgi:hypothetical protein